MPHLWHFHIYGHITSIYVIHMRPAFIVFSLLWYLLKCNMLFINLQALHLRPLTNQRDTHNVRENGYWQGVVSYSHHDKACWIIYNPIKVFVWWKFTLNTWLHSKKVLDNLARSLIIFVLHNLTLVNSLFETFLNHLILYKLTSGSLDFISIPIENDSTGTMQVTIACLGIAEQIKITGYLSLAWPDPSSCSSNIVCSILKCNNTL